MNDDEPKNRLGRDALATHPPTVDRAKVEATIRALVRRAAQAHNAAEALAGRALVQGACTLAEQALGCPAILLTAWINDETTKAEEAMPRIVMADGRRPTGGLIQ